jgi:hypothetical protein
MSGVLQIQRQNDEIITRLKALEARAVAQASSQSEETNPPGGGF